MCELLTIAAALVFTALCAAARRANRPSRALAATAFMFWGAALMWAVDCVANRLDGEPLLDLSREDALLGAIILASGLLVYAALSLRDRLLPRRA